MSVPKSKTNCQVNCGWWLKWFRSCSSRKLSWKSPAEGSNVCHKKTCFSYLSSSLINKISHLSFLFIFCRAQLSSKQNIWIVPVYLAAAASVALPLYWPASVCCINSYLMCAINTSCRACLTERPRKRVRKHMRKGERDGGLCFCHILSLWAHRDVRAL